MGTRAIRTLGLIPLLLVAACGKSGGGSSPAAVDPTVPVLSNLQVSLGERCTVAGVTGSVKTVTVDYTDADGDLRGGVVDFRATFNVGPASTLSGAIPSRGVASTGTTSGSLTLTTCLHFGGTTSFTQEVRVTDASGKVSNIVSETVVNPGLPLAPGGAGPREALEAVQ